MEFSEHIKRHNFLHKNFDELLADYLIQNKYKLPSTTTIMELMKWSAKQCDAITIDHMPEANLH